MNDDERREEYRTEDGAMVFAGMMVVSAISVVVGILLTLAAQWLMAQVGG